MEIVVGLIVYFFVGAILHGFLSGSSGGIQALLVYVFVWPLILATLAASSIRERLKR